MKDSGFRVALVGASTLKGKELKEALEERKFPVSNLRLLDEEDLTGQLAEFQGEPTFIRNIDIESFRGVDFAFFCATPLFTKHYAKLAEREGCRIVDLTEALEEETPPATVAAPLVTGAVPASARPVHASAHPAAMVVAWVLRRLAARVPLARAVVNVFEPASERGAAGVEELHKQTVSLLSFHEWPREVFDAQLAFNLLAGVGEESRPSVVQVEKRVVEHVRGLLGEAVPATALRLAQAATFHAHSFSFYVELTERREAKELEDALSGDGFDIRRAGSDAPTAVDAAAGSDVLVGDVRRDQGAANGYWLWAAADNLRLLANNAVRIAEAIAR